MSNDQSRWRIRHDELLEELSRKSQRWAEGDQILRKAILRLLAVSNVGEPLLARKLKQLRTSIENNTAALYLDDLVEEIAQIIDARNVNRKSDLSSFEHLFDALLQNMQVGPEHEKELHAIRNKLANNGYESEQGIIRDFTSLLAKFTSSTESKAEKKDIFSRLFAPAERHHQDKECQLILETFINKLTPEALPVDLARDLIRQLGQCAAQKDYLYIFDLIIKQIQLKPTDNTSEELDYLFTAIQKILLHLLEQLDLPSNFQPSLNNLRGNLAGTGPVRDILANTVQAVADLLLEICTYLNTERQDVEEFMSEVKGRLRLLDQDLQQSVVVQESGATDTHEMTCTVEQEISGIKGVMDGEVALDSLKLGINNCLDKLQVCINEYSSREDERRDQSLRLIKKLSHQLYDMERRTEDLHAQLRKQDIMARLDSLTQLPNRKAYEERIQEELERFKRYGSELVLTVWDVDHFKNVNDNFGHAAGDRVLYQVAEIFKSNLRKNDFVARYGGEEFVTLMYGVDLKTAGEVAEKLRLKIMQCQFHFRDQPVPITISGGIAACKANDTSESLFDRADKALYEAKALGRNQCVVAKI